MVQSWHSRVAVAFRSVDATISSCCAALPSHGVARETDERQRLRSLAADYCVEHGVSDLTLRRLGQSIGSNNRMMLYYFGSKEGLILEALVEALNRFPQLEGAFTVLERADVPLGDRLLGAWRAIAAEESVPYMRLFFEVFGLAVQNPERFSLFLDTVGNTWTDRVAKVLRVEGVPLAASRRLGREMVGLWRGLQFDLLASGDRRNIERSYESAVRDFVSRCDAARNSLV